MVENTEPLPAERASEDSASISSIGQSPVDQLLALLETEYVVMLTRLSAHVRSPDVEAEIIHDVYVKMRSEPAISEIHSPRAYLRSEECRVGKECVSTCRSRWLS